MAFNSETGRAAQKLSSGKFNSERAREAGKKGGKSQKHHADGRPMGMSIAEWKQRKR